MSTHALPYSPGELVRQCVQAPVPRHQQLASLLLRKAPQFVLEAQARPLAEVKLRTGWLRKRNLRA